MEGETNHKPLVIIFRKALNDCPPHIQRLRLKLHKYDLKLKPVPGIAMYTLDSLSRGPEKSKGPDAEMPEPPAEVFPVDQSSLSPTESSGEKTWHEAVEAHGNHLIMVLSVTDQQKEQIRSEEQRDHNLYLLGEMIARMSRPVSSEHPELLEVLR